ncbi:MAG: cytochrome oxidase subunit III, partial [Ignavibacteria bacterium]|nr:cytochrome oxidase subunit III [Ignavibacteria bacterium]
MKYKNINKSFFKFLAVKCFVLSFFSQAFAEGESDFPPNYYDIVALVLLAIIVLSLLSIIYFEGKLKAEEKKKPSILLKVRQLLTKSTPIEREQEILFDHEYDGIKELDSKIPPWFTL